MRPSDYTHVHSDETKYELRNYHIYADAKVITWPLNWKTHKGKESHGIGLYKRHLDGSLSPVQEFWDNGLERNL